MAQRKSKVQRKSRVQPKSKTQPKSKYDSPWKDILEIYFEDFLQFFFPNIHSAIDWTQPIEFLNKELKQVTKDAEVGRMTLSKNLEREFQQELNKYEEKRNMPYVTSIVREGKLQQTQQIAKRQLNRRVGELDPDLIKQVEALPIEALEELTDALLDFSSVTDLQRWLQNRPTQVEQ